MFECKQFYVCALFGVLIECLSAVIRTIVLLNAYI